MEKVKDLIDKEYQEIVIMKKTSKDCWTGHKTNLSKEEVLEKYANENAMIELFEHIIGYNESETIIDYEIKLYIYLEV